MKLIILFLFVLLHTICLGRDIDRKCSEKLELINRIINNPDKAIETLKKSSFFSNEFFGNKGVEYLTYDSEVKDLIKAIRGQSVLMISNEHELEVFSLCYIGENNKGI